MGRGHFPHRAAVVYSDVASLRAGLDTVIAEGPQTQRPTGGETPTVAFAYTGQASQIGMGRNVYETEPAARAVLDRCAALLREWRGTSLIDVMFGVAAGTDVLDDPSWTQPAIYALECALSALWASIGYDRASWSDTASARSRRHRPRAYSPWRKAWASRPGAAT